MAEFSMFWGGTTVGDAALAAPWGAPYSDDSFSDFFGLLYEYDRKYAHVAISARPGYAGGLVPSYVGSTVTIQSGVAMVDGKLYASSAAVNHVIASDGTWSVVLRKTWATQTIRQMLVATASITQVDGVTWDVELCRATRTGGTIVTFVDYRLFLNNSEKSFVPHFMYGYNYGTGVNVWDNLGYYVMDDGQRTMVKSQFTMPTDIQERMYIDVNLYTNALGLTGNFAYQVTIDAMKFESGTTYAGAELFTSVYAGAASTSNFGGTSRHKTLRMYTSASRDILIQCRNRLITVSFYMDRTLASDTNADTIYVLGQRISYL